MPPGPKPLGERAMILAERQARYRAAHAADTAATVKVPLPPARRPAQPPPAVARRSGGTAGAASRLPAVAGRAAGELGGYAHG